MFVSEDMKQRYLEKVYKEMNRRGFTSEEIPRVIAKTGFMTALNQYPEEQLHYPIKAAVNEIVETAAKQ